MNRLSPDQNGIIAPSVPSSDRADQASSRRTQSFVDLSAVATTARVRPSGDTASRDGGVAPAPKPPMIQPAGGRIAEVNVGESPGDERENSRKPSTAAANASSTTRLHAIRSRMIRDGPPLASAAVDCEA